MSILSSSELQRLRYRQGQMLRSRDFRDQVAIEAQLRWWHNRALHNAFGVVDGFEVRKETDSIRIGPGVAYDCFGRELINMREQLIPFPVASEMMMLLAQYKETRSFPRKDEVSDACLPGADSFSGEEVEFIWKPSSRVNVRDGVPLVQVSYDTSWELDPDTTFKVPHSRGLARPHIASGATIAGQTAWTAWKAKDPVPIGVQVRVDTSAAGFTEVPCYFAWLQGPLWKQIDNQSFLILFEHIDEPSINSFVFRLWTLSATNETILQLLPSSQIQGLSVFWLGIQPHCGYVRKMR